MSDQEQIKQLRLTALYGIQDVVEERDTARRLLAARTQMQTETQAKLAKAVAALQKISRHANRSCSAIAARALAELEADIALDHHLRIIALEKRVEEIE